VKFKHVEVEFTCTSEQGNNKYRRGLEEEFPKEIHDFQASEDDEIIILKWI
jgi:hypothetical protein